MALTAPRPGRGRHGLVRSREAAALPGQAFLGRGSVSARPAPLTWRSAPLRSAPPATWAPSWPRLPACPDRGVGTDEHWWWSRAARRSAGPCHGGPDRLPGLGGRPHPAGGAARGGPAGQRRPCQLRRSVAAAMAQVACHEQAVARLGWDGLSATWPRSPPAPGPSGRQPGRTRGCARPAALQGRRAGALRGSRR